MPMGQYLKICCPKVRSNHYLRHTGFAGAGHCAYIALLNVKRSCKCCILTVVCDFGECIVVSGVGIFFFVIGYD